MAGAAARRVAGDPGASARAICSAPMGSAARPAARRNKNAIAAAAAALAKPWRQRHYREIIVLDFHFTAYGMTRATAKPPDAAAGLAQAAPPVVQWEWEKGTSTMIVYDQTFADAYVYLDGRLSF